MIPVSKKEEDDIVTLFNHFIHLKNGYLCSSCHSRLNKGFLKSDIIYTTNKEWSP